MPTEAILEAEDMARLGNAETARIGFVNLDAKRVGVPLSMDVYSESSAAMKTPR